MASLVPLPWNGIPLTPNRHRWHWLKHNFSKEIAPKAWDARTKEWTKYEGGGYGGLSPSDCINLYSYVMPCLLPKEMANKIMESRILGTTTGLLMSLRAVEREKVEVVDPSDEVYNKALTDAENAIKILIEEENSK